MFTGATAFFLPFLPARACSTRPWRCRYHLYYVISTQVPEVPEALPYGVALVLIADRAGS